MNNYVCFLLVLFPSPHTRVAGKLFLSFSGVGELGGAVGCRRQTHSASLHSHRLLHPLLCSHGQELLFAMAVSGHHSAGSTLSCPVHVGLFLWAFGNLWAHPWIFFLSAYHSRAFFFLSCFEEKCESDIMLALGCLSFKGFRNTCAARHTTDRYRQRGESCHLFGGVFWHVWEGSVWFTLQFWWAHLLYGCWVFLLLFFFYGSILLNCCHFLEPNTKGHQIGSRSAIKWTLWMSSRVAPVAGT